MTDDQKQVAMYAGIAAFISILSTVLCGLYPPVACNPSSFHPHSLWINASLGSFIIGISLLFCIGKIAKKRFFNPDAIAGAGFDTAANSVTIDKAILQNTFEQVLLAIIAYQSLEKMTPNLAILLIPTFVFLFMIGRILFILGYKKGAGSRALGFGLTFYPTVIAYIVVIGKITYSLTMSS